MVRPNARSVSTEMEDVNVHRDGAVRLLPGKPVGPHHPPGLSETLSTELPITETIARSEPPPAAGSLLDHRLEPPDRRASAVPRPDLVIDERLMIGPHTSEITAVRAEQTSWGRAVCQLPGDAAVRDWLERHPRVTFHFTPTSASWLNQIETWFGILTRQAICRGTFGSVRALIAAIDTFTANWNDGGTPFTWVTTADEILAKAVRKRPVTSESRH